MCATSSLSVSYSHSANNVFLNPALFDCVFRYLKPSQSAPAASVNRYFQSQIHDKLFANQLGIPFSSTETCTDVYTRALMLVGRIGLSPFVHPFLNLEKIIYSIAPLCLPETVSLLTSEQYLEFRSPIRRNLVTRAILTNFSSESSLLSTKVESLLVTESPNLQTLKYAALLTTDSICKKVLVAAPRLATKFSVILREVVQSLFLSLGAPEMPEHGINNKVSIINCLLDHEAKPTPEEVFRISQVFVHFRYASLPPLMDRLNKLLVLEERFDFSKMTIIKIATEASMNSLISKRPNDIPYARRLDFCNSTTPHLDGNLVIGEQMVRGIRVLMAYDQQSYECRWGVSLRKDVIWEMTADGIAAINSEGLCVLFNPQTGQIHSAGKIPDLVGWSRSQLNNEIHMTSSGVGYYFKKGIFGGLQQVNGTISLTFKMKCPAGEFIALGPYAAFRQCLTNTCSVFNAKGEQHILLNIDSIKAANGHIYMVYQPAEKDQPSILRVVPEGNLFSITDYTNYPQIKLPGRLTRIKEVFDDGTVLCLSRENLRDIPHFIQIDKEMIASAPPINPGINKIYVDKKCKAIWYRNASSCCIQHFSAITGECEQIGKLALSSDGEIVYIGYENESPIIHFVV